MWLIAQYLPSSLFSLRMSNATNAVAKTLLLPSPYCIKMALLNASFQVDGIPTTEERFEWLRRLIIRIEPPEQAVVNNSFVKIQKLGDKGFVGAFALREYISYYGELRLAFDVSSLGLAERSTLSQLLYQINQLGKRGCFIQIMKQPATQDDDLPATFACPLSSQVTGIFAEAILQSLDDMESEATLTQISSFSDTSPRRDMIRRIVPTLVPYRLKQSSKGFTHYERSITI